ncbi:hypothetical protein [Methylobacterium frigidaeris]|uniref:Exopolysaccharide production protein YjbE n=1 Tax=Methylobacterium frigidaeris TaxID=2038277 RepID=A0AA37HGI2_9HYPH|nr:hypothetical protein [Methylobacterium frigidaeris]GJD65626.1 hypothetical protein MPEAHAMD_5821 [Methylobacterium frigidaeris]
MRTASSLFGAATILVLTASSTLAGPCATANTSSSNADRSTKNLADGQQPSSPKTVGAMNYVAASRATSPADVTLQAEGKPTMAQQGQQASQGQRATNDSSSNSDRSTKNVAGGQQPDSPKTVGAMNNVGANQISGRQDPNDGC